MKYQLDTSMLSTHSKLLIELWNLGDPKQNMNLTVDLNTEPNSDLKILYKLSRLL